MNSFEEDGVWFLPDAQDRERFGRLTFSPDKPPKLYLMGQLQEIELEDKLPTSLEFPIIHGYLVSGEKVTLCECNQPIGFKTGIPTSEIYVNYILRGHHFKSLDDVAFKGISVRYEHLENWLGLSNFEIQYTLNQENTQVKELNVKQKTLDPLEIGKLLGFSIFIYDQPFNWQTLHIVALFGQRFNEVNLKENKSIVIRSDVERSLKDFVEAIYLLQDLLTFASGQLTYPYEIRSGIVTLEKELKIADSLAMAMMAGFIKAKKVTKSDLGFEIHQFGEDIKAIEEEIEKITQISIYFQVSETKMEENEFDIRKVIFCFDDIKDQSKQIIETWELNARKVRSIIDLYLRLTYIPRRHINDLFLSVAQAIEGFHRLAHEGVYIDKEIYKNVVGPTLVNAIPSEPSEYHLNPESKESQEKIDEFIKALGNKIQYLNEYSLKERLEDLIREYEQCLPKKFFQSEEEKTTFGKQVRETRGKLTHPSSDSKSKKYVVSGNELIALSMKLKTLLEICLVKQLGFHDSDVKRIFSRGFTEEQEIDENEDELESAGESFRQGWYEAMTGKTLPVSQLWEGIDAD
ncbi:MAG TPA: HEPN domain-containing protein [Leptolyngbyaceae cyanobacterium]